MSVSRSSEVLGEVPQLGSCPLTAVAGQPGTVGGQQAPQSSGRHSHAVDRFPHTGSNPSLVRQELGALVLQVDAQHLADRRPARYRGRPGDLDQVGGRGHGRRPARWLQGVNGQVLDEHAVRRLVPLEQTDGGNRRVGPARGAERRWELYIDLVAGRGGQPQAPAGFLTTPRFRRGLTGFVPQRCRLIGEHRSEVDDRRPSHRLDRRHVNGF